MQLNAKYVASLIFEKKTLLDALCFDVAVAVVVAVIAGGFDAVVLVGFCLFCFVFHNSNTHATDTYTLYFAVQVIIPSHQHNST